ncbi:hypothetical protein ACFL1G_02780 [Planctomycetota bacterium]
MPFAAIEVSATTLTIIFIILAAIVGAFVRRRKRDKCLDDFSGFLVIVQKTDGQKIWGRLNVENTGLELFYPSKHADEDGHDEASYILYKNEYPNMQTLIRFHDELSESNKKRREEELAKTYHPGFMRRLSRRVLNVFRTVRDSVMEVFNLLISQAKKATPAGGMLSSQDKYISQMKQELTGSVGTSYEPLLEKYIGRKVVLELIKGDKVFEYCGVLKDYTAEFIEVMDVNYKLKEDEPARKADLVVLRKYGIVRHLGE